MHVFLAGFNRHGRCNWQPAPSRNLDSFAFCPRPQLTEISVTQARTLLLRLKRVRGSPLIFVADGRDVSHLPSWVNSPKQITDGHLSGFADANGAVLATLDENIPS